MIPDKRLWDWVRQTRAACRGKPDGGLFIPLEVVKREYPGKILLTAEMISRGMPVFLGHKLDIIRIALKSREAGILLYKSAWGPGCDFFKDLIEKGFAICAQDEESGIIYERFEDFFNSRTSLRTAGYLDRFFCWGIDEYEHLQKNSLGDSHAIRLTGSPRAVTWGPLGHIFHRQEIEHIKGKHGSFVLFATNFATGNSYLGDDVAKLMASYPGWEGRLEKTFPIHVERERRLMRLFAKAAAAIGQKLGKNVVIRPHPTEDNDQWKRLTREFPRVTVCPDGPVTPWLLAADCLIHNRCTTGLEAAVADVPTFAFGDTDDDFLDEETQLSNVSLPNRCSIQVTGVMPLLEAVANADKEWETHRNDRERIISRKLHKPGTLEPLTAIADSFIEISGEPNPRGNSGLGHDSIVYDLREFYRTSRFRRSSPQSKVDQGKRPSMRAKMIRDDMRRALDLIGSEAEFTVVRIAQNAFKLQRME